MNSDELQRLPPILSSSNENEFLSEGTFCDTSSENDTSTSALLHSASKDNINLHSKETLVLGGEFYEENGQALCKSEKIDLVNNNHCLQANSERTCFQENEEGKGLFRSDVRREEKREDAHGQQQDREARPRTGNDKNAFNTTFAVTSNAVDYLFSRGKENNESTEPNVRKNNNEGKDFASAPPSRNEKKTLLSVKEISTLSADLGNMQFTIIQQAGIASRGQEFQDVSAVSSIHGNLGLPAANRESENKGESLDNTRAKPRIIVNSKSKSETEEGKEAGISDYTLNSESENTADSVNPLVGRKLKSKIVEEKFKEYEKENKAKQTAVRKKLRFTISNAEKAIVEARMIAQAKYGARRKSRDFLRVRTMRNRSSMDGSVSPACSNISYSSMSDRSKTPNEDKIEDIDLARKLQADLDRAKVKRWNTVNERQLKGNSPALTEKSSSDGSLTPRGTSIGLKSTRFERYEVEWLVLELRNLNLYDQAHNLSLALRKKEDAELQLRLELKRERKKAKEMARRAKKAELEQERREERKRKQMENERRERERLERMELERQRQLEEDRKRREHDKILLANFNKSVCATSISRSNTFSYFPLLANKPPETPKEQRRLSVVKSRKCALITSKYRQPRSKLDS